MSSLAMTKAEEKSIDFQVEQMMDWAKTRSAEAEQLALDSARLMACTTDRVDRLKNQGFFKRCWNRLSGKAGEMERANTNDIIQMQKTAFRYVNMLQEQQLLMAHSLLSLKNNLVSLAVKEEETRNLVTMLAQRTLERFEKLEHRVGQIEISTNLQAWLLGLEEREYDEKIPTEYMRLFRVINDFYNIKRDNWNYNDLMFMRKAIRTVGLNPKQKISLNSFIDKLTDEIQSDGIGFDAYGEAISLFAPEGIENYSKYVLENISSPVFVSMHGLKTQYMDKLDVVEELQDEMNISAGEALKRLIRRSISNMNVNLDYEFPLAETAIEILGCMRLSALIATEDEENSIKVITPENTQQDIIEIPSKEMPNIDALPLDSDIAKCISAELNKKMISHCVHTPEVKIKNNDDNWKERFMCSTVCIYKDMNDLSFNRCPSNAELLAVENVEKVRIKASIPLLLKNYGDVFIMFKDGIRMYMCSKNVYINRMPSAFCANSDSDCTNIVIAENIFMNQDIYNSGGRGILIAKNMFVSGIPFGETNTFPENEEDIVKQYGQNLITKISTEHKNWKLNNNLPEETTGPSHFSPKSNVNPMLSILSAFAVGLATSCTNFSSTACYLSASNILYDSDAGYEKFFPEINPIQVYNTAKMVFDSWVMLNHIFTEKGNYK